MNFDCYDADSVLYFLSKALLSAKECAPRGMKIKELICPIIKIQHPELCVIKSADRKLSYKYLAAEMLWYLSGEKSISGIDEYASMWKKIQNPDGTVNSNYGEIIFFQEIPHETKNQFDWVIDNLTQDKDSRQAVINFNQPKHKYPNNKDMTCTISIQYLIRENKLISITTMRSNDLIYGLCYDLPFFSLIQQLVYYLLLPIYPNLHLGYMLHIPGSLHVYEKHYSMIKDIVDNYNPSLRSNHLPMLRTAYDAIAIYADIKNQTTKSQLLSFFKAELK